MRVEAAVRQAGAVAGGETAARILGIAGAPTVARIAVLVPPERHPVSRPGVRVLRSAVPESDLGYEGALPITSPLRTVVDCARRSEQVVAVCLLESAFRQELVTAEEVSERLAASGRERAVSPSRIAAGDRDQTAAAVRQRAALSGAAAAVLLDRGGRPDRHRPPGGAHRRAGPALLRTGDRGRRSGAAPARRDVHHDRIRQNALEEQRWLVRRFTDPHVRNRPGYVVATVRRAFDRVGAIRDW
ncbi:MAG TPA: type IV toxin-antitoxin system AbiEi family antitoxin [Mycobacteriales bacterium]|nr:type IV toxin-antitoxin system AbiEi family antitoxin [Mycobacteriales bacterium]